MTKRLYSTEQVLDALLSDDEDFALDDENKPMMAGSDDEFSDMEVVPDDEDDVDEALAQVEPPSPVHSPLSPSTSPSAFPADSSLSPSTNAHPLSPSTHTPLSPSTHAHPVSQLTHAPPLSRSTHAPPLSRSTHAPPLSPSTHAAPLSPSIHTVTPPSTHTVTAPAPPTVPLTVPPTWSHTLTPVTIQPFTSPVGPTVPIPESPMDIFSLCFTEHFLQGIVGESNRYAQQVMGQERFYRWTKITLPELRAYMGFCNLMGINKLPCIEDYWRRDPSLHYSPIADRITRDRFRDITRYCHFVNNDTLIPRGSPGHDRLGKVRPVMSHLSAKFSELYNPHRETAVDEAMIKFQGRSSLKQLYMPMKPIKRGIKVWVLADSHTGYFCKFQVYTGRGDSPEKGLGSRVVKSLMEPLKKFHHVYFDNFFTSEQLLVDLERDGIYACGTPRKDRRGFPPALKQVKFKQR